jgi:hypothetical protein
MTLSYPIKRAFIWGNETGRSNRPDTFRKLIGSLIKSSCILLLDFLISFRRLDKYERFQHWFIEEGKNWGAQAGYITGRLGLKISLKQN